PGLTVAVRTRTSCRSPLGMPLTVSRSTGGSGRTIPRSWPTAPPLVNTSAARVKTGAVHWMRLHLDATRSIAILLVASSAPLFDDLIRAQQQRRRNREAERLGGLHVDRQLEPGWSLDWKVTRLRAPRDAIDVIGGLRKERFEARAVAHQAAQFGESFEHRDRRKPMLDRQVGDVLRVDVEHWRLKHHDGS